LRIFLKVLKTKTMTKEKTRPVPHPTPDMEYHPLLVADRALEAFDERFKEDGI
jgi:hypothetical protein